MRWNKFWGVIFFILGILVGIVGIIVFVKNFSVYTLGGIILFLIVCFILILYGVKLYSIKGKRAFHNAINQLIQDLAGMISLT